MKFSMPHVKPQVSRKVSRLLEMVECEKKMVELVCNRRRYKYEYNDFRFGDPQKIRKYSEMFH